MKITSIKYWKEDLDLTRPYAVTYVMHDSVENLFVQIQCEEGIYGLGSGSPSEHVTGELMDTDFASRSDEISSLLVGRDIRELSTLLHLVRDNYRQKPALCAALDMAIYDAFCKYIDVPLLKFLGQRIDPLPTSVTIGIKGLEETLEDGREYLENGFKIIKLKIGHDMELDAERFIKLRELVGSKMKIRVDANQGFDPDQFKSFISRTKDYEVEFFEQPFKRGMSQWMMELNKSTRDLCAADEDLHNSKDALDFAQRPYKYGIYNIKLMKSGGITEGRKIAQIADNAGINLMWGCMDESRISISAALNIALASRATRYLDLDGSLDLAKDIVRQGFELREGILYPKLEKPGLGVTLL